MCISEVLYVYGNQCFESFYSIVISFSFSSSSICRCYKLCLLNFIIGQRNICSSHGFLTFCTLYRLVICKIMAFARYKHYLQMFFKLLLTWHSQTCWYGIARAVVFLPCRPLSSNSSGPRQQNQVHLDHFLIVNSFQHVITWSASLYIGWLTISCSSVLLFLFLSPGSYFFFLLLLRSFSHLPEF